MTPTMELMTNQEQIEYLGMDGNSLKRLIINVKMDNGIINSNNLLKQNIMPLLQENIKTISTPLDQCLEKFSLSDDDDYFTIFEPEKIDFAVAVLHDTLMMKLFPPKNLFLDNNKINFPIFEVEYIANNIPAGLQVESIINSFKKSINLFESELLIELLNKAVRSQRNKIEKDLNFNTISESLELIERENEIVYNILTNTRAYAILRQEINPEQNTYRGINIINFSPSGRMNKNRVYFMGVPSTLGRICKSNFKINIDRKEDQYHISCLVRMGAVILNRDVISVIEH